MNRDARAPAGPGPGRLHGSFAGCRTVRQLASGGMAQVHEAFELETGARLALKLVFHQAGQDARAALEAEREGAMLQARLGSIDPRVARIFRYGDEGEYFYVLMEFVDGEDLSHLVERGPVPVAEAVRIAVEVCEVLRSAHSLTGLHDGKEFRGIVHGDIKPRNIRLTPRGGVKVLDFGIAKALSLSRRLTRNEFGSLPYSSAERLETGSVDEQSDLWALGVVLHEMLGGRLPFQAETTEKLDRAIRERRPPPPLADCPPPLRRIVDKALAPRLEQRYADADALHADLVAFREGRPTLAGLATPGDAMHPGAFPRIDPGARGDSIQRSTSSSSGLSTQPGTSRPTDPDGPGEATLGATSSRSDLATPGDAAQRAASPRTDSSVDEATRRTAQAGSAEAGGDDETRHAIGVDESTRRTAPSGTERSGSDDATRRTLSLGSGAGDDTRRTVSMTSTASDDTRRTVGAAARPAFAATAGMDPPVAFGAALGEVPATAPALPGASPSRGAMESRSFARRPAVRWAARIAILTATLWAAFAFRAQWRIGGRARSLAAELAAARVTREDALEEHTKLLEGAWTPLLVAPLRRELLASYAALADAVIEEYRSSDAPLVREKDWRRAAAATAHALEMEPRDKPMRARRALIEGHLSRIGLTGRRAEHPQVNGAIRKFRDAAELADWGDPYLGLAAIHAYVQHDPEGTDAAVEQVVAHGRPAGRRERAQRADARLLRAVDMWADRSSIAQLPEERQYVETIREHLAQSIELYGTILGFENTHANLRRARRLLERVDERLAALDALRRLEEPPAPEPAAPAADAEPGTGDA